MLPSGLGAGTETAGPLPRIDTVSWLEPLPTAGDDPAEPAALRDSTRLAVVAAFQRLPARQRAVLMLVDVASFRVQEAAETLGMTTTAARSALQRARATLAADRAEPAAVPSHSGSERGKPNAGSTLFSKRVMARTRSPAKARTYRPVPWRMPDAPRR
ncbi:sigma factor-like helix-turn-helix DNA-binding protein [Amycolatopsis sp. NPDC048633]|uniref:sigma factor-like helix-turn-helix DNA-binding protein n=1 Tax=Amycolatopsis sp. NPDC048633 TaxID=3157095 RepID=UPI0033EF3BF7